MTKGKRIKDSCNKHAISPISTVLVTTKPQHLLSVF
jgi:hypothetical protein